MRLYLVQHGQAKSKDQDPDRHLTENGQKEVESIAAFLQPLNIKIQALWHSGKARAAQTADILAGSVKARQGAVQHDGKTTSPRLWKRSYARNRTFSSWGICRF